MHVICCHVIPPQLVFENYDQSESGSLNGQKVNTPYPSKDHLQQKRYIAQSMGTTYVYDFLELFRQVTHTLPTHFPHTAHTLPMCVHYLGSDETMGTLHWSGAEVKRR